MQTKEKTLNIFVNLNRMYLASPQVADRGTASRYGG